VGISGSFFFSVVYDLSESLGMNHRPVKTLRKPHFSYASYIIGIRTSDSQLLYCLGCNSHSYKQVLHPNGYETHKSGCNYRRYARPPHN